MIITGLFSIFMVRWIVENSRILNHRMLIVWSVGWLMILFSYEQIVGVAAVIIFITFVYNFSEGYKVALSRSKFVSIYILIITVIFILLYTMSPGNPKIITLNNINKNVELTQMFVANDVEQNSIESLDKELFNGVTVVVESGRLKAFFDRIVYSKNYLYGSIFYGFDSLVKQGVKGILLFCMVFMFAFFTLFIQFNLSSKKKGFIFISTGLLWSIATIAPFFLYKQVHIPPYTLLIPSVGLGVMIFGFACILLPSKKKYMYYIWLKGLLFVAILIMPVSQYGYYFGLREELSYWESIATNIEPHKQTLKNGGRVVLHNIPIKKNNHIFWIESLVGYRYLYTTLGIEFPIFNTQKRENDSVIVFSSLNYDDGSYIDVNYKDISSFL